MKNNFKIIFKCLKKKKYFLIPFELLISHNEQYKRNSHEKPYQNTGDGVIIFIRLYVFKRRNNIYL